MNSAYFIYRVSTFATTCKTAKGAILKEYVEFLENTLIDGKAPVQALVDNLNEVVDHLNKQFPRTKAWHVSLTGNQIHIEPINACRAFESQALAVINFSRVRTQISPQDLAGMYSSMVDTYAHIGEKGGGK